MSDVAKNKAVKKGTKGDYSIFLLSVDFLQTTPPNKSQQISPKLISWQLVASLGHREHSSAQGG